MVHETLLTLITEAVEACGHHLYACFFNQDGGGTLHILVDDAAGLTLADCITVTNQIEESMLQHDIDRAKFHIEVASPGVDRPLFTPQHYKAVLGRVIQIKLDQPDAETRQRQFTGALSHVDEETITLVLEKDFSLSFHYDNITQARVRDLGKTGGRHE